MRPHHCRKHWRASIRIVPIILCGGSGTRLWPLSREKKPKQLLALTGTETMFQLALRRVEDSSIFDPPLIVSGADQADQLEAQAREAGVENFTLIIEPCARNTAAAIALAAQAADSPARQLLVLPSDHLIQDVDQFLEAVGRAYPVAEAGWLTTFGIRPDRPETGYGYIRRGGALSDGVFEAAEFVEKPDMATAEAFLAGKSHDWNAGIFQFQASALLSEIARQAPAIHESAEAAMAAAKRHGNRILPESRSFEGCPAASIDKAVMEHAAKVAVVPVQMGWSDLGSWEAMHEIAEKDDRGNALTGTVTLIDSKDCLIRTDGPHIAALGVEGLVIVASGESILVVPKDKAHLVKDAVEQMKAGGKPG